MPFKRIWDETCPKVWDKWEADGVTFMIQDLPEENEEEALDVMLHNQCNSECRPVCTLHCNFEESMASKMCNDWRKYMKKRTSLVCFAIAGETKEVVGVNVCFVKCTDDKTKKIKYSQRMMNIMATFEYIETRMNVFEYIGDGKYLTARGLVVKMNYRNRTIGTRLLKAREPLCRYLGIKGTATIFNNDISQKMASNCGFTTLVSLTYDQLSNAGFMHRPERRDVAQRTNVLMAKKYY